ncbi:MAG: ABC transporter ATP-binding protein [Candidatus Tectomicrobia bacterium]|nr:ABC transporter ATP-binding protein [Candidatus Tectomicrobia bacterium]
MVYGISTQKWDSIVEVEELTKKFGDFTAVSAISFQAKEGEILGFLGPNGAGKSTLIKMLCGILKPTSGHGQVSGFDLSTEREKLKELIGYMSQRFSLYDDLTVLENIEFFGGVYGLSREKRREREASILDMFHLEGHRESLAGTLSGGMKQKLALGCAIIHEPRILFLDEPTSGVDPSSRRDFWDLIYHLSSQRMTVFVSTHYMDEAEHCDRLAFMHKGELIALGTPKEIKDEAERVRGSPLPTLHELFIMMIKMREGM